MKLNQVFYSIAACCLLIATFVVLEVSAYSGNSGRCDADGDCLISPSSTHNEYKYRSGLYKDPVYESYLVRYKTANVYDFRGRDISMATNIQDVRNDSMPVILFNSSTVFPEDFNPYSDMFCHQLSDDEILCFYPKL